MAITFGIEVRIKQIWCLSKEDFTNFPTVPRAYETEVRKVVK